MIDGMPWIAQFRGELAALGAALIWAVTSLIYVGLGKQMSPLVLNFTKSSLAIGMIGLTLLWRGDLVPVMPAASAGFLTLSGAIGIGLGDTAFFASLNAFGARRSLLMESLAPPLAALLAMVSLGELLGLQAWLGILLTVGGVAWVVLERTPESFQGELHLKRGLICGLLAALGQASGAVLSRAALADTAVSPLWSSLIRLVAGVLVMVLMLGLRQARRSPRPDSSSSDSSSPNSSTPNSSSPHPANLDTSPARLSPASTRSLLSEFRAMRSAQFALTLFATSLAGTFLAIWLQQTALKYTATGIAQSLGATSPLFVLPIAMLLGDRVSGRSLLGVLVSLLGIRLLFL